MQHNQYSIPLFLRDLIKAGVCCYVCNYLTTNNEIFFCRKWKKVTSHSFESSLKLKWKKCSLQLNSVKWTVCKNVCSGICLSASSWNSDGGVWIPHIVYQWTLLSPGYFVFWYLLLFFCFFFLRIWSVTRPPMSSSILLPPSQSPMWGKWPTSRKREVSPKLVRSAAQKHWHLFWQNYSVKGRALFWLITTNHHYTIIITAGLCISHGVIF